MKIISDIRNTYLFAFIFVCCLFIGALPVQASGKTLFDVEARKQQLQTPEYTGILKACLAEDKTLPNDDGSIPQPISGLQETEGYGTDRSVSDFAWFMMVQSGRALAGDEVANAQVKEALLLWSSEKALIQTEQVHDAYYALKRVLLPIIVSYTIVQDDFSRPEQKQIENWIDPLVRKVDHKFDGDVDWNNHRYLADSVLALWGSLTGDKELYAKGKERFLIALDQQMTDAGGLPLENRRGSRALWYLRQSVTDLTLIAEIYKRNGDDLYGLQRNGKSLSLLTNHFLSGIRAPQTIFPDAAENYIPGPSQDFMQQDLQFLETRGGRRHYMAFSHPYINHFGTDNLSSKRLQALMQDTGFNELPLIDDYIGGNATCIWGSP